MRWNRVNLRPAASVARQIETREFEEYENKQPENPPFVRDQSEATVDVLVNCIA